MSRETAEYLRSLHNGYEDQGPQVNWTRGFEGNHDQFSQYTQNGWYDTRNDDSNQHKEMDRSAHNHNDLDYGW